MAQQNIPGWMFLPFEGALTNNVPVFVGTTYVLDSTGDKVGVVFYAPKAGDISKISFPTRTVTTGADVDVRIETVDMTTGNPSGTLWATNTNVTQTILSSDDNTTFTVTLTANATVARGDVVAVVISMSGAGNMQIATASNLLFSLGVPYALFHNGTSWSKQDQPLPFFGVEYSDGSYAPIPHLCPISAITNYNPSSSTNPNHYALRFRLPFPATVWGAWIAADLDKDSSLLLVADNWDGTTGAALDQVSFDPDVRRVAAITRFYVPFDSGAVTLAANTTYRLVFRPDSTAASAIYTISVGDANRWGQFSAGTAFYLSTANNPNDSTDWTDTTTERPLWGLLLGGADDATGSSGIKANRGMTGGMY